MEAFFRLCTENDEVSTLDLLYHRYGTIPDLEFSVFANLIQKAREEEKRREYYEAWVALLPLMQQGYIAYISFTEYYDKRTGASIDLRPAEDILAEVEEIRRELQKE